MQLQIIRNDFRGSFGTLFMFNDVDRWPKMNILSVEECELLGDSKYRSYVSQIEKALKAFDSTTEWADLISALAKLNKVIFCYHIQKEHLTESDSFRVRDECYVYMFLYSGAI